MIRALCVALMLALATPASAKTLIVADVPYLESGLGEEFDPLLGPLMHTRTKWVTGILDATKSSYTVIPVEAMRTEWARTGVVTWDFGTSSARTESFDAVIHVTFTTRISSTGRRYEFYRPESLTRVVAIPTVPQLFLPSPDHSGAWATGQETSLISTSSACSLGVTAAGFVFAGGGNVADHDEESVTFDAQGSERWTALQNTGQDSIVVATIANKGYRRLVGHGKGSMARWQVTQVYPGQADSTITADAPGQASVFMVQNSHMSGAKPTIVAHVSDGATGTGSSTEPPDFPLLWAAMAALDSASGGKVFDNKAALPLRVALTADGLCSRSSDLVSRGFVPSDSTQFYATMDSIAAYSIPITFGVNLDSVATYQRDLQYVKDNVPTARFTPQSRAGLDTAAAFAPTGGITHRYRAVDTFGRYRNQSRAYGPAGGAVGDTSLFAKLIYAKSLGDSLWGAGRSSRFALPPDDDWSPYNLRGWQLDASRGVLTDSILYAYAKAGFRGIRINGFWTTPVRPQMNPTNPIGFMPEQGRYETADRSLKVNLIAHNGHSDWGNRPLNWSTQNDSTLPITSDPDPTIQWHTTFRFWSGLSYAKTSETSVNASDAPSTGNLGYCRILRLSCQELAGKAHSATMTKDQATRPGWWSIRRIAMPIRTINRLAGRSIISLGYPEDIRLP